MKMRIVVSGAFCIALCCIPACAQGTAASEKDQKFVDFAAQTDMTEAHLGQLAQDQASSQAVKDFAQMLVTDHTDDYRKLSDAATKAGATVPKGLDAQHNKMIAPFEKLKGAAFDRRFEREMVAGHTKAIAEYKRAAADLQSADLKAYATATLPALEKHLDAAKGLEKAKSGQ
jgi:putative membrane protein